MFNGHCLKGKQFLITGGSSGIGRATALAVSRLGARVILVARNQTRLEQSLASLVGEGHSHYTYDLSQADGIPQFMLRVVQERGALHGLFHAAGLEAIRPLTMINSKSMDEIFRPSTLAGILLARGFCQKGVRAENERTSLVFMSSVASLRGQAGMAIYSATKAAMDGAIRSLAPELAAKNIRINSITAGAVVTEMHQRITGDLPEESIKVYENKHLFGFGRPEDIAQAAVFLLSEASAWITGTSMVVDGGYTCR